ncbi:MAG: U32 family peptidase [Clostridia bacterium]|nr:U32 family peptidase [Clostridia bacterium]
MMELLSPAGSRDSLVAAVQNGADAVYFGGSILNARRSADNFAGESLVEALDYCHERGVNAYITLNTLVFDRELGAALDFAHELYRFGADAVLVQDLGLAALIRHELPELTVHASTQMGIHDEGGLKYCERMGINRAVLAREVDIEEIKRLSSSSSVEIETFAHGALCMSFSGSCLYSASSGERSGNRGTCAQPCRKAASVFGAPKPSELCLSPNDICMIEHLRELESAGVCCVKLEGRMKKPEYVAAVTRCYRAALDGASKAELASMKAELFMFFNRGAFSTAHFFGDSVKTGGIGSSKPDPQSLAEAKRSLIGENRKRNIKMHLKLAVGEPACLVASVGERSISVCGERVETASQPQSAQTYSDRLKKLGDTPFELADENCTVEMLENCYISSAALNALRREAAEKLAEGFHIRHDTPKASNCFAKQNIGSCDALIGSGKQRIIYCLARSASEAKQLYESGADIVALEPLSFEEAELSDISNAKASGKKLILALPNVLITKEQREFIKTLLSSGAFDGAEANNIGQTELIKDMPLKIAGIGLNAINTFTISELARLDYDYIVPSVELTSAQMRDICSEYGSRLIIWTHGRIPSMQLLHCPVKEYKGCQCCSGDAGRVTDEAGREFPLVNIRFPDKCLVRMLNSNTTDLVDILDRMPKCAGYRMSFNGEPAAAAIERLRALKAAMLGDRPTQYPNSTRGHWNRKVD